MSSFKPNMPPAGVNIRLFATVCVALSAASLSFAQDRIYRCAGNVYTNNAQDAAARDCKLVEGANLTVVSNAPRVAPAPSAASAAPVRVAAAPAAPAGSRIDTPEQRGRDSDARAILQSELKKLEGKQADLLKEFNNGEPEKRGPETRNNQMYLDRVAEMKAQISRNDADIAGIKREIGRTQPAAQ
jgi:3-oxoacyl-ACP reductase-like protein